MKAKRSVSVLAAMVAGVLTAGGCQSEQKTASADAAMSVNRTCPIMGSPVKQDNYTMYKGEKVAFCCKGCDQKFEKMTEADKDAALAKSK